MDVIWLDALMTKVVSPAYPAITLTRAAATNVNRDWLGAPYAARLLSVTSVSIAGSLWILFPRNAPATWETSQTC
jgi:hypothetical protein